MYRFVQKVCVLRPFLCVADNYQVNAVNLCTSLSLFRRRGINEANPGLDRRLNLFKEDINENVVYDAADSMDEENMQDDLMNFNQRKHHSNNNRQMDWERDQLKRQIVKQKYFKTEKQTNFLTWAEKEQIRQLHSSDATEWSTEKLAQSFPAPENVIKKIIKSRWAQENLDHILRHDKSVQKNWKELTSGKLKIDSQLKEHLMKFTKRNQAGLAHDLLKNANYSENVLVPVENVEGEFSNMVKSCRGERSSTKQLTIPGFSGQQVDEASSKGSSTRSYSNDSDTFLLDLNTEHPRKTNKIVTLSQYKQEFNLDGIDIEENKPLSENSEHKPAFLKPTIQENNFISGTEKLETSVYLQYPERITIPKNKWKEGGTYKAGDCYYDDDGEFLYRVPGMK